MLHCWDADQESRPDFSQLVAHLGDFLETGVRQVSMTISVDVLMIVIAIITTTTPPSSL